MDMDSHWIDDVNGWLLLMCFSMSSLIMSSALFMATIVTLSCWIRSVACLNTCSSWTICFIFSQSCDVGMFSIFFDVIVYVICCWMYKSRSNTMRVDDHRVGTIRMILFRVVFPAASVCLFSSCRADLSDWIFWWSILLYRWHHGLVVISVIHCWQPAERYGLHMECE